MEPEELYDKLEKLREIKAGFKARKPMQFGNPGNLNYHAIIGSMPRSISFSDLMSLYDYMQDIAKENSRKAGRGY